MTPRWRCCWRRSWSALAACGDDEEPGGGAKPQLTVSAAASLKEAFTGCGRQFAGATAASPSRARTSSPRRSRRASSPTSSPRRTRAARRLFDEGLVEKPTVFAGNRRAGGAGRRRQGRLAEDLEGGGVKLAVGRRSPDRRLHPHGARQAPRRPAQGDPRQRALRGARRGGHHGRAHPGRGRRRLPLRLRRPATDDKLEAIELPTRCSRRSPTASRWSRGPRPGAGEGVRRRAPRRRGRRR